MRLTVTDPASNTVLTVLNIPTDVTGAFTATLDSTFFRVSSLYTLIATDFVNSAPTGTITVSVTSAPPGTISLTPRSSLPARRSHSMPAPCR